MSHQHNTHGESSVASWFADPLSDEAAAAVYLFLQQFTLQFEDHYYAQIRRHYAAQEDAATQPGQQINIPWEEDDEILF